MQFWNAYISFCDQKLPAEPNSNGIGLWDALLHKPQNMDVEYNFWFFSADQVQKQPFHISNTKK